jgi:hypothetical protein
MSASQIAPVPAKRFFVARSIHAGRDLEMFLVTAIATILIVRGALAATGWPQLGGGKIHVAHLLWGGLGMLVALILFMVLQGRLWKQVATLLAGIGFGLFIDELGKFITSDNDYFFQPAVAIIYLLFVMLFLVGTAIVRWVRISPHSALVNALGLAQEAVIRDLSEAERTEALTLLAQCDQTAPLVQDLTQTFAAMASPTATAPRFYVRLKTRLRTFYQLLLGKRWLKALVVGWFVLVALGNLLVGILVVAAAAAGESGSLTLDFWKYGQVVSSAIGGVLVVLGLIRWRSSRLAAYRWFERALLFTIFVTQFFSFYNSQFTAVSGLVIALLTYLTIRFMIREEEAREESRSPHDPERVLR